MKINLDNLSIDTLVSMVQDLSVKIEELDADVVIVEGDLKCLSNSTTAVAVEDGRAQAIDAKRQICQQFCDAAQDMPTWTSALAVLGTVAEQGGYKAMAIQTWRKMTGNSLEDAANAIKDWRIWEHK